MNVIVVSQARFGIKSVIQNLLDQFTNYDNLDLTYLTIGTHEAPNGVNQVSLLDESRLRLYEDNRLRYLCYAVLNFWRRAYEWLADHYQDYDIIWLHTPRLFPLVPDTLVEKLLVTHHNHLLSTVAAHYDFPESLYYRAFGQLQRRGLRTTTGARYTAVNPAVVKEITDCDVDQSRIRYVENGVDTDQFSPDVDPERVIERYNLSTNTPLLLFLGRLTGQKRPDRLVERFSSISAILDGEVTLVIAGKGPRSEAARDTAAELGLDNVQFLGYVPEKHKAQLYVAADYYVLPSSYEGSPMALYEALASGTPAIASDLPGTRFISDANCGLVVDFDEENWSRAEAHRIAEYITAENDHSTNARQYAEQRLDWSARASKYHEEFERILHNNN